MGRRLKLLILLLIFGLHSCAIYVDPQFGASLDDEQGASDEPYNNVQLIDVFTIGDSMVIVGDGSEIEITLPYGTDVSRLTPQIMLPQGATIVPASGVPQDFTNPVVYTVTSREGVSKQYTVRAKVALSNAKEISVFMIDGQQGAFSGNKITVTLPFGSSLTDLMPIVVHNGHRISPDIDSTLDFVEPVTYTVTAADSSVRRYTVTVVIATSDEKDILSFSVADTLGEIDDDMVYVTVPYRTNINLRIPEITHSGNTIVPDPSEAQDFRNPVVYRVTAQDGSYKDYTVIVSEEPSDEKDILSFAVLVGSTPRSASIVGNEISVSVPYWVNLANIQTSIQVSDRAAMSAEAWVHRNFSESVVYTVIAEDLTTKDYIVTVTQELSNAKEITSFSLAGFTGTISGSYIYVDVLSDTNISSVVPVMSHNGDSISPSVGSAHDFTEPVTYTVTAEDETSRTYTVLVSRASASAKNITSFAVSGVTGSISGTNISLTMPYGTNVSSLAPVIKVSSGASVSPASGSAQNFSESVIYTVTAQDSSTQNYTVTINVASSSAKDITAFNIQGINATISGTNISLMLPYGSEKTALEPVITHTGASISPANESTQDFTNPIAYTVTASDSSTKTYTVTVTVALNEKDITAFYISGRAATINGTEITLTMPYGTNRANLSPTISVSAGATISPASGVGRNFTNPVTYTVTAPDGTTKVYTVTVTNSLSTSNNISSFAVAGSISSSISGTDITVLMPGGTNVTALTPTIAVSADATVSPASGEAVNFTSPVTYTVTAENGDIKEYTVTINLEVITYNLYDTGPTGGIIFYIAPDGKYSEIVRTPQWLLGNWVTSMSHCANYSIEVNGNIYDDWDIPSPTEGNIILTKSTLRTMGNFSTATFWTNREQSATHATACAKSINGCFDGVPKSRGDGSGYIYHHRCVRRFY